MTTFEKLCAEVAESVKNDLKQNKNTELILSVYNEFQENARNGVDYIFDIDNAEDLICCVQGGMTVQEIVALVQNGGKYFHFGENYKNATPIKCELNILLYRVVEDFVPLALLCATRNGSYSIFYEKYVTEPNDFRF